MNDMKRKIEYAGLALAALVLASCGKEPVTSPNDSARLYFDAWAQVRFPDAPRTALGSVILEDVEGGGELVGDYERSEYVRVNYTVRTLDGTITNYSGEETAKQLGTYNGTYYYGPAVWGRTDNTLSSGIDEIISGMKVGGRRSAAIPGWLFTSEKYGTAEEYLASSSSGSNAIYTLEVVERITDVARWEADSINRYMAVHYPEVSPKDTVSFAFYYMRTREPSDEKAFPADTTIYINYVGRLLDGKVFDTNIADTAKVYGLYSASGTYTPSRINWPSVDEGSESITMGSDKNSVIAGFSSALWRMHAYEAGTAIFYSTMGYGSSGTGYTIPGYCPLRFDIEIVDKPE